MARKLSTMVGASNNVTMIVTMIKTHKKNKILLFAPALFTSQRYGDLAKVGPTCEPLGLAYLASALRASQYSVSLIDGEPLKFTNKDLINHLKSNKYDFIGIGFMTPQYLCAKDIIQSIRKEFPELAIIAGGPHITIMPKQTMQEIPEIDYGVLGESEKTIVELLDAINTNRKLERVDGIVFRKSGSLIMSSPRAFECDLDRISLPARDLLPMSKYTPAPTYYKKLPSFMIITSRGCPFRCVYCSKIFGNSYRHHSVKRVLQEMNVLIKKHGAKDIIFRDDTFTIDRAFVINLCSEIIRQVINKKINWMCMTRVNLVDFELLKAMKKAGCWSIHFGVESGSQRLLNLIQKDITLDQIKRAFKAARRAGIQTKAFFMLGLPTETRADSLATIQFAKELDPDAVQFTITVPYPGTKLYELAKTDGTLKSFNWEDYQTWAGWTNKHLVYIPGGRTEPELKQLQRKAFIDFYLRPKIIARTLLNVRSFNVFSKLLFGGFAIIKNKFRDS